MNNDRTLSKDSTIYNYRLLRRVHHKAVHHYAYWLLTVLAWIYALLHIELLSFAVVLFGIPLVHAVFLHTSPHEGRTGSKGMALVVPNALVRVYPRQLHRAG